MGIAGIKRKAQSRLPTAATANSVDSRILPSMANGGSDCFIRATKVPCLGLSSMKIVFAKPTYEAIIIITSFLLQTNHIGRSQYGEMKGRPCICRKCPYVTNRG